MENKQLLENLSHLGYPLLESKESFDVNKALGEAVKSKNVRFFEGFPVMLANAAKAKDFDYSKVETLLKNKEAKKVLKELFLVSLALYQTNDLYFDWAKAFENKLADKEKEKLRSLMGALNDDTEVKVGRYQLNPERVRKVFQNYFANEAQEVKNMNTKRDEMSLEFSLSQVFSSKQKDLFKKKLKGEVLTKTEREYFSRVVRKKTAALANPELHRLAQKVLQN